MEIISKMYIQPESENNAIFLPASQRTQDTAIHGCINENCR